MWRKLGLVYSPRRDAEWARSHAMVPTPLAMDDHLRVYFNAWDAAGRARPGFVDLGRSLEPLRDGGPLLDLGEASAFDANGIVATSVVAVDDRTRFLYYVGFDVGGPVPYRMLTGL